MESTKPQQANTTTTNNTSPVEPSATEGVNTRGTNANINTTSNTISNSSNGNKNIINGNNNLTTSINNNNNNISNINITTTDINIDSNNNNNTSNNNNETMSGNSNNIGLVKPRLSSNNLHSSTGAFMQSCLSFLLRSFTVKRWIEKMVGEELAIDLYSSLPDGVILCRLMLSIKANSIPKIHTGTTLNFKIRENLLFFLQALEDIGVSRYYLFSVADLIEKKNYYKVLESLEVLADIASTDVFGREPEKQVEPVTDEQAADLQFSEKEISDTEALLRRLHINQVKRQPCKRALFANEPKPSGSGHQQRASMSGGFLPTSSFLGHNRLSSSGNSASLTGSTGSASGSSLSTSGTTRSVVRASLSPGQIVQKARQHEKKWVRIQALARGHLTRIKYHKRVRMAAYRHNIVKEILSTEEIYVKNLENLQKFYFEPLTENASKLNIKAAIDDQLKKVFSNLEVIKNYNNSLLGQLRPIINDWSSSKKIGPIFIQFIFLLKVYTQYVKEYTVSYEAINNMRKNNSKFDSFILDKEMTDGRTMSDYLILPVQRIPRYTLLLADLVKNTWSDHIDYQDLTESLKRMQEVALSINEKKREAENIQKVTEIQNNFVGKFENLAEPHRRFVHEGSLGVINPGGKESQRIFYLFNDVLIGTKPTTSGLVKRKGALKVKESIRMNLVSVRTRQTIEQQQQQQQQQQQLLSTSPEKSATPLRSSQEKPAPPPRSSPAPTPISSSPSNSSSSLNSSQEKPPLHPAPSSSKPPNKPQPKIPEGSNSFKSASHSNTTPQQFLRQSAPPTMSPSSSKPPLTNDLPTTRTRTSTNSPTGIAPLPYKNRTMTSTSPPQPPPAANKPTLFSHQKPPASPSKPPISAPPSTTTTTTTTTSPPLNTSTNSTTQPQSQPTPTPTPTNNSQPNPNSSNSNPKSDLIIELVDSFGTCILKLLCHNLKEKDAWITEFKKVQDDLDSRKIVNDEAMKRSQERAGLAKAALSQQYATLRVRGRHIALSDAKEQQEQAENEAKEPSASGSSTGSSSGLPIGFANQSAERDFQILRRQTIGRRSGTISGSDGASSSSAPSTPNSASPSLTPLGSVSPKNSKEDLISSTMDSASADDSMKKSTVTRSWFSSLRQKKKKPSSSSILEVFNDPSNPTPAPTEQTEHN